MLTTIPIQRKTILQDAVPKANLGATCPIRPIELVGIPYISNDVGLEMPQLAYSFVGRTDGWLNWIPNTGELSFLGKIQLPTDLLQGMSWSLQSANDYGLQACQANISANPTIFDIVALATVHPEDGLSVLDPSTNTGLTAQTNNSPQSLFIGQYIYNSSTGYYNLTGPASGSADSSYVFFVDGQNLVVTHNGVPYEYFAIVAVNKNSSINPCPGDDIHIQIKIGDNLYTDISQAPRLAVYDKKMLWRANLYIAEMGAGKKGSTDWNDLHPWVDGNDWNLPDGSIANPISGGQIIAIQKFSSPRVQDESDDVKSPNSVCYDYPTIKQATPVSLPLSNQSMDTPFDYNNRMVDLKGELGQVFADNGGKLQTPLSGWSKTTAPNGKWSNYLLVGTDSNYIPSIGLLYYDWNVNQQFLDANLHIALPPSFPLTTIGQLFHDNGTDANGFSYNFAPNHIGTDCVGFAKNSVSYSGSSYQWNNKTRNYPFPANGLSVQIAAQTDSNDQRIRELKNVVPGDVFYYWELDKNGNMVGDHIGIILSSDGTGSLQGIRLVEAYFFITVAYVNNIRSLSDIDGLGKNWVIVRLQ